MLAAFPVFILVLFYLTCFALGVRNTFIFLPLCVIFFALTGLHVFTLFRLVFPRLTMLRYFILSVLPFFALAALPALFGLNSCVLAILPTFLSPSISYLLIVMVSL
jgi:hypothetical protein